MDTLICPLCGNKVHYYAPPNQYHDIRSDGEVDMAYINEEPDQDRPYTAISCENPICKQRFMMIQTFDHIEVYAVPSKTK